MGVVGHLLALVPGDTSSQFVGQCADRLPHGLFDTDGVAAVGKVQQEHIPGGPRDERADRGAAITADEEIALPVTGTARSTASAGRSLSMIISRS
jgi:hypothetical protein